MRRAAVVAAALLLGLSGCRTPVVAPAVRDDARALARLDALRAEARSRRALRGVARMAVDGDGSPVRATYALVLERPSHLRVEIRGLFGETLGVLVTDGRRYDWFRADDGTRESGRVYDGLLFDVAGVPLTPREVVDLLLGAPLPQPGLVLRKSERSADGALVAAFEDGDGSFGQRFEFDAEGRLRRVETRAGRLLGADADAEDGSVLWDVRYDDYDDVDGSPYAHDVALAFPAFDTHARVSMHQVELNPELAPDAFVLNVPGG